MTRINRPKTGLCLCGGGITGAIYQVGCLAALEDRLESFKARDFDLYVGTAAGATVATVLAGGLSVQRLYRALLDPADDFFPLQRGHLLHLDLAGLKHLFFSPLSATRRLFSSASAAPPELGSWNDFEPLIDALPDGLFALDRYELFLREFMARRGIPNRFAELPRPLLVTAYDLDAGQRAVFGKDDLAAVPISEAVAASSAVPVLFAPYRIGDRDYLEGGLNDVAHLDLAEQAGCRTIVVINPVIPVGAGGDGRDLPGDRPGRRSVPARGLVRIYNQARKEGVHARLRLGLERFRKEHPATAVVLLEPEPADAALFLRSPANAAARRSILEQGYASTARALRDRDSPFGRRLRALGLPLAE